MSEETTYRQVTTIRRRKCLLCERMIPAGKTAYFCNVKLDNGKRKNWCICAPCHENVLVDYGEYLDWEDFNNWLFDQPDARNCPVCKSEWISYSFSDDEETALMRCRKCKHEWKKHIGFDAKEIL